MPARPKSAAWLPGVLSIAAMLVLWTVASQLTDRPQTLPAPWQVAARVARLAATGELWLNAGMTLFRVAASFALAMAVFATVTLYGLFRHGAGFLKLFVPDGVPLVLTPIIVPIEVISYLSRPVSHSVRLFAVMLAGHITLKVFAGFVVSMSGLGALGMVGALLPFAMTVALTALELLMAVIQAYVFTMLTCMYLNDALHPGH